MIGAALALPLLVAFTWVAAPGSIEPMFAPQPPWYADALPWFGVAVYLIGLIWMARIHRTSHLEPEPSGWRYRD
jgi:hypothetical protein